jgi:XTP/dITP diphosphohydrolase
MSSGLRRVLFASTNPHKVDEVRAILGEHGIEVVGLEDVRVVTGRVGPPPASLRSAPSPLRGEGGGSAADLPEPEEDADTFEGNAAIKAVYYARATGMVCLADDSGLMVDALGGAPGVRSARYAGIGSTRAERDAANNAKLLRELAGVPDAHRTARFVCAMVMASPEGEILATTRGTFEGRIGLAPKGSNGFGYDPLLVIDDGRTSAELTEAEKNARSHRGEAARAMVGYLV